MKAHYVRGGLGDSIVKRGWKWCCRSSRRSATRQRFGAKRRAQVLSILKEGTDRARERAASTVCEVDVALGLSYFG